MGTIILFSWVERLGFAGWFGVGTWFGFIAAPAIFAAGIPSALAVLFPPLFWYGVGCGAAALVGALGSPRDERRAWRLALAAAVFAGALVEALVIVPMVARAAAGSGAFGVAHTFSTTVALVTWLAAGAAVLATG